MLCRACLRVFFFKQKTAYDMRISDWSSDVCSSDLIEHYHQAIALVVAESFEQARAAAGLVRVQYRRAKGSFDLAKSLDSAVKPPPAFGTEADTRFGDFDAARSEEHTSELQSLMRISYAVFCLKKKTTTHYPVYISIYHTAN